MPPNVKLKLAECESKGEIYAEENKVLTLKLVNSQPWVDVEEDLANYKVGISLNGEKVKIIDHQVKDNEMSCQFLLMDGKWMDHNGGRWELQK